MSLYQGAEARRRRRKWPRAPLVANNIIRYRQLGRRLREHEPLGRGDNQALEAAAPGSTDGEGGKSVHYSIFYQASS